MHSSPGGYFQSTISYLFGNIHSSPGHYFQSTISHLLGKYTPPHRRVFPKYDFAFVWKHALLPRAVFPSMGVFWRGKLFLLQTRNNFITFPNPIPNDIQRSVKSDRCGPESSAAHLIKYVVMGGAGGYHRFHMFVDVHVCVCVWQKRAPHL